MIVKKLIEKYAKRKQEKKVADYSKLSNDEINTVIAERVWNRDLRGGAVFQQ